MMDLLLVEEMVEMKAHVLVVPSVVMMVQLKGYVRESSKVDNSVE
jgi:hypothetical protein